MNILLWIGLVLFLLISYQFTPRKRQIRALRRTELQRSEDLKRLVKDCKETYHNALLETPYLKYRQDVRWIEWHTKLANPEVDDPGPRPIFSEEDFENDTTMQPRFGDSYVMRMRRLWTGQMV